MFEWIPGDSINCVYFALVAIGLLYTIISLIGADFDADVDVGGPDFDIHLGDFDVAGVHVPELDIGVDAPDADVGGALHLPSISPFSIASFVTGFGAAGMVANLAFNTTAGVSLVWAALGGLALGGAMQVFFGAVLLRSQGSSDVKPSELAGIAAEVTVPIEPEMNGQIAFVAQGRRVTYVARGPAGQSIARGTHVEVVRVVGGTALVRPIDES